MTYALRSSSTFEMPEILPPHQIETPEYTPGMTISVQPPSAKHINWLHDHEYYDQLGRDPLQVRRIWGISDPEVRVEKLKEVLNDYPNRMHRRKILLKAADRGDEDIVRYLVGTGMKVQFDAERAKEQERKKEDAGGPHENFSLSDEENASCEPVHLAAVRGKLGCLKVFLESGIEVDSRDEFGRTLLIAATQSYAPEVIKYLLEQGADPTAVAGESELAKEWLEEFAGAGCLEAAARHGRNIEILEIFLKKPGIRVTPKAIQFAMGGNQSYKALRLLLERGGCLAEGKDELIVHEENSELRQALIDNTHVVVEQGDLPSLKLILGFQYPEVKTGNMSDFKVPEELHKHFTYAAYTAVQRNEADKFEWIYSLGLEEHDSMSLDDLPDGQHLNVQHLLDHAAESGSVECARLLVGKYGADPHKYRLPAGILPLYWAAGNDKPEMVRFLLEEHKVDIHMGSGRYSAGPTALWVAIRLKAFECISLLLQHGGPVDHIDDEILNMDDPLDAILTAATSGDNVKVELKTEDNAQRYIDSQRHNYQKPNSTYVRVKLTPEHKPWIDNLQLRKLEDLRRDWREFSANEAANSEQMDANDIRRQLPDFVTFQEREDELNEDDDLIPKFEPAFVARKRKTRGQDTEDDNSADS